MNQITLAILALRDFLLEHVTTLRWERKAGGIGLRVSQIFVLLEYEIVRWNVRNPNPKATFTQMTSFLILHGAKTDDNGDRQTKMCFPPQIINDR